MRFYQTSFIMCLGLAGVLITGCSSTPKPNPQALPLAQAEPAPPQNPAITAKALNEESKSIAVTDIYFKKEGKNLSYIEETRRQSQSSSGPVISSVITPKVMEVDADKADASAITGGPNSSAFPVKFTNLADPKSTDPSTSASTPVVGSEAPESTSSSNHIQTMKKSGYEAKNEYGELRYLANPIRGLLIKSGYKVVQARPSVSTPTQGDEYFDIVRRIKAGDFGEANYVLYGVLAEVSLTDNIYDIPGTSSSTQQVALDVVVDFNVIDTNTSQIVASFIGSGVGNEVKIDGKDNGFKHSMAKLMKLASISLAEDVQKQLAGQNFITAHPGSGPVEGRNFKRRLEDDTSTLKVYGK
ncbi:MAG: hypothetical protein ACOYK2_02070 [Polynucleobacter sp.]